MTWIYILKTFGLLKEHKPGILLLVFILTLFHGACSGFTYILLIPMLQLLNVGGGNTAGGPVKFFHNLAERIDIPISIESILLIYVVLLTFITLTQYWESMLVAGYQQTFIYQLRRRIFRKILLADWQILKSKSKTNHIQVLTKEVPNLSSYYYYYLRFITTSLILVSYLGYALLISTGFTIVIITLGAIIFVIIRKIFLNTFELGEGIINSYNRLLKFIDDFWQTVKIAKVHNSEKFYYDKFDKANRSLLNLEYMLQKNNNLPQLVYRVTGIFILVFTVYAGYKASHIPLASFFILILLFSRIFPQFVSLNTDLNIIISNTASVKLVMKLDEEFEDREFQMPNGHNNLNLIREIRLENIVFSYPEGKHLFDNFSSVIYANSITGILGESGSGKTTLIDLIAGLRIPESGRIMIDGKELNDDMIPLWKSAIGYLPQEPLFIDGTLRENLVWDSKRSINEKDVFDILDQVNAAHLPRRFKNGLDENIVNYQYLFSGGECQRLALARVLLRKPQILLLDEATSSLDNENEILIMEVLKMLKAKVTILFVTNKLSLQNYFDDVIRI